MTTEAGKAPPEGRPPTEGVRPLAVSAAAADLIGRETCGVLALHQHGASLQVPGHSEVLFLSPPGRGLFPLHVVVESATFRRISSGDGRTGGCPALRFRLEGVRRFTVRVLPDPVGLRGEGTRSHLRALAAWLCDWPGPNGFGQPTAPFLASGSRWRTALQSGHRVMAEGVRALLGRGQGTTPAGDDFLVGALAHAWASQGAEAPLIRSVGCLSGEFDRLTTATSATYLRAALRGEFSSHLASLARALPREDWDQVQWRAQRVVRHGATSGVDTLTGFLAAAPGASPRL